MQEFALDPATLPATDILELAQAGLLCRAERETPSGGIPAFVTRQDWDCLAERFGREAAAPERLIEAVERAVWRLLSHAAATLSKQTPGSVSATMSARTDLFSDDGETYLSFVRDRTHPVACVIVGSRPWSAIEAERRL
ncbi:MULTISPECIES: hypothetical protein [Asaia]|uniref:Uncharacterized protein n=1 Tax=Asaia spathodeae TaxID=657016 RepID=A0ABX2P1Q7_9PROT|nr:hypothetical protein [Asaia spathodeae]GBR14280.1 hypothetical protein AA105894_1034 [Asaia spathodeae NBRC 105894]